MIRLIPLALVGLLAMPPAEAGGSTVLSTEEQSALASFQALLDGIGARDRSAILTHSLPGGRATLMRKGKPLQMTLEELADKVSAPGKDTHQETIREPLVRVDDDVAIVWARFEFLVNGKIDHCGRDVATLMKVEGRWLVASLEDNATTNCGR